LKTIIVLPSKMDNAAQAVLSEALDHCAEGELWIDAGDVTMLGARSLEHLLSVKRTIAQKGGNFGVVAGSDAFWSDMQSLGMDEQTFQQMDLIE